MTNVKIFHEGDHVTVADIAGTINHSLLRPDITVAPLQRNTTVFLSASAHLTFPLSLKN